MTFRHDEVKVFLKIFENASPQIAAFEGCQKVQLMSDIKEPNVYFTHSIWISEDDLNNYRKSDLFKTTWRKTKALFSEKAQAWSLKEFIVSQR
jgi:heme-degrading monooxygenase HmoA